MTEIAEKFFGSDKMKAKIDALYNLAKQIVDESKDIGFYSDEEAEVLQVITSVTTAYKEHIAPFSSNNSSILVLVNDPENPVNMIKLITNLDGLCKRLQDDYNGGPAFEQCEEDRLAVYNILELLDEALKGGSNNG